MTYIRYGLVFLAVALGAALLIGVLNTNAGGTLGSGAQLMVPAMIAALIEGQQFARNHKARASSAQLWGFTWIATLIATGLNVALAYLAAPIAPEFAKLAVAAPMSQQFLVLLGLYAGGYLVFNRIFYGIGIGNQLSLMRSRGEVE